MHHWQAIVALFGVAAAVAIGSLALVDRLSGTSETTAPTPSYSWAF
jgi:hypothetical protein